MIFLKPIRKQDAGWARNLGNRNRRYFSGADHISKDGELGWFISLGSTFFVIWKDTKRVGTISVRAGEINNVIIDTPYRRKGIFREVVKIVKKMYPNNPVVVEAEWDNQEAIRAYTKIGFTYKKIIMELP